MEYRPKLTSADPDGLPAELSGALEILAAQVHDAWAAGRLAEGWRYGERLDETAMTHPCLVPYGDLPEHQREYDRRTAAQTIRCLLDLGYTVRREGEP